MINKADNALKKPDWLRVKAPQVERIGNTADLLSDLKLNTVCQEASCPNIGECFSSGTATFLIMGPACTRACPYCDIKFDRSKRELDPTEPYRLAEAVYRLKLNHVVITSVNRDDLNLIYIPPRLSDKVQLDLILVLIYQILCHNKGKL